VSVGARLYSLAFLTSHRCTAPEALRIAAATGYDFVGLRLWPNQPGTPQQHMLNQPLAMREALAIQKDTGVGVYDLEVIRIDASFKPHTWDALFEAGAALQAKAVLVVGDDTDEVRLTANFARLCEVLKPFNMTANLEFLPWTGVPDAKAALRVVTNAGRPANAGILVDALHYGRSRTMLDDIRAIPTELLHYAQICDAVAGTHFSTDELIHTARCERLMPGEGTIDVRGLFDALPASLPVSIEIVNLEREANATPTEWAAACLSASRAFLEPKA
jgi:sugar phosphate isomerase/epimerase